MLAGTPTPISVRGGDHHLTVAAEDHDVGGVCVSTPTRTRVVGTLISGGRSKKATRYPASTDDERQARGPRTGGQGGVVAVDGGGQVGGRPRHTARGKAKGCMVRRRRITTACFLDVIRAPCGRRTFRTRHGVLGGAGEGTAAPGATGLRTALKRTKSPAAPRGCRCRRDACGQCRWHSGGASSKEAAAGTAGRRGLRACVPARGKRRDGEGLTPRSELITTAHVRSNVWEKLRGWTVFHLPSTPDGR